MVSEWRKCIRESGLGRYAWAFRYSVWAMDLSNSCERGLFIHGQQWDLLELHSSHRRVEWSSSILRTPFAVRAKTHSTWKKLLPVQSQARKFDVCLCQAAPAVHDHGSEGTHFYISNHFFLTVMVTAERLRDGSTPVFCPN